MPKLKFKNLYAKDLENLDKYKVYDVLEIEYQNGDNDEVFAKIVNGWQEGKIDALDAYDGLAKDMIISPVEAQKHTFFGKNATAATQRLIPFLLKCGNEDMLNANKKLELEEADGE